MYIDVHCSPILLCIIHLPHIQLYRYITRYRLVLKNKNNIFIWLDHVIVVSRHSHMFDNCSGLSYQNVQVIYNCRRRNMCGYINPLNADHDHISCFHFFIITQPFDFQAGVHARIQIYWCRSSIFRHLKLELLPQFPASNDEKYINVVYI